MCCVQQFLQELCEYDYIFHNKFVKKNMHKEPNLEIQNT